MPNGRELIAREMLQQAVAENTRLRARVEELEQVIADGRVARRGLCLKVEELEREKAARVEALERELQQARHERDDPGYRSQAIRALVDDAALGRRVRESGLVETIRKAHLPHAPAPQCDLCDALAKVEETP